MQQISDEYNLEREKKLQELINRQREEIVRQSNEIDSIETELNIIKDAFFWRATKPFRKMMDKLKIVFKGNRAVESVCNFLRRIKDSLKKRKTAANSLMTIQAQKEKPFFYYLGDEIAVISSDKTESVVNSLNNALAGLNVKTNCLFNQPNEYNNGLYFIVSPNQMSSYPKNYVIFQTQPVSAQQLASDDDKGVFTNALAILDFSLNNIECFNQHNDLRKKCYYVPLEHPKAFDYYFYRFMLANDWISFDQFYDLSGDYVSFESKRICLSLPEQTERRRAFDEDNSFGFQVVPGLRNKKGWVGCALSYKYLMKRAKEQNLDNVLICEDDVFFPPDFDKRLSICLDYLDRQDDWQIFQGLMADIGSDPISDVKHENGYTFVHLNHMISTVFNIYNSNVYDKFIAWNDVCRNMHTNTIDRSLQSDNIKVIASYPFLVGHKEDLMSAVWDFKNTQYSDMIALSSEKLGNMIREYEKNTEK